MCDLLNRSSDFEWRESFVRALIRHPASKGGAPLQISAELVRGDEGLARVRYDLRGPLGEVRLPPPAASARVDELWRTTCFEAFVGTADGEYFEFNFAPSTRWAAYRFDGYRRGMAHAEVPAPSIAVERGPDRFELRAEVSGLPAEGPWHVGLTAVIEDVEGRISYWALAHPGDKPDFHHPDSFVLELPVP